jgi:hypothetical protein
MRRSLAILVLTAAASVVTPFGAGSWSYAVGLSSNGDVARLVTEWQRTSPLSLEGGLFYLTVLLAVLVLAAVRRRERWLPSAPGLVWLGGLVVVGTWAERGIVWWAFGAPAVLAPAFARLRRPGVQAGPARSARPELAALRRLNLGIALALVALVVLLQPAWRPSATLAGPFGLLTDAPVGLAAAMRATGMPSDRAVVPQRWASWFEWAAPVIPVMADSRIEVVPPAAWADYLVIAAGGPGTLKTLARIRASLVVVDRREQGALLRTLWAVGSGWHVVAEDADGAVFRSTLTGAAAIGE